MQPSKERKNLPPVNHDNDRVVMVCRGLFVWSCCRQSAMSTLALMNKVGFTCKKSGRVARWYYLLKGYN